MIANSVNESSPTIQAEQVVRQINDEWVAALTRGDTATLDRLMDNACIFSDALSGEDKAQFIADLESGEMQVSSLNRENVEVRVYGATAVMTALDTAEWRYKGRQIKGHYRTIHVYTERGGVWQIVAIQASPISLK
ncbi:MAG TPA: nuclear transport factor 2 family protein [Blastocatellia bacterium]|nr:nuclear transport factor 2 family protein [Blastocatellia bacterium]